MYVAVQRTIAELSSLTNESRFQLIVSVAIAN